MPYANTSNETLPEELKVIRDARREERTECWCTHRKTVEEDFSVVLHEQDAAILEKVRAIFPNRRRFAISLSDSFRKSGSKRWWSTEYPKKRKKQRLRYTWIVHQACVTAEDDKEPHSLIEGEVAHSVKKALGSLLAIATEAATMRTIQTPIVASHLKRYRGSCTICGLLRRKQEVAPCQPFFPRGSDQRPRKPHPDTLIVPREYETGSQASTPITDESDLETWPDLRTADMEEFEDDEETDSNDDRC